MMNGAAADAECFISFRMLPQKVDSEASHQVLEQWLGWLSPGEIPLGEYFQN